MGRVMTDETPTPEFDAYVDRDGDVWFTWYTDDMGLLLVEAGAAEGATWRPASATEAEYGPLVPLVREDAVVARVTAARVEAHDVEEWWRTRAIGLETRVDALLVQLETAEQRGAEQALRSAADELRRLLDLGWIQCSEITEEQAAEYDAHAPREVDHVPGWLRERAAKEGN